MRQIDHMSDTEIDILHLKGMLSNTVKTSNQQGETPMGNDDWCDLAHSQQGTTFRDYEPEQKYGTAHDIQEHIRYGGSRNDY